MLYFLTNYFRPSIKLIERERLIDLIVQLRKRMYSALREIAYVANYLKITEEGLEAKKIRDIMLRDGATADAKLQQIEELIFQ